MSFLIATPLQKITSFGEKWILSASRTTGQWLHK
jgi:hypothetical protein